MNKKSTLTIIVMNSLSIVFLTLFLICLIIFKNENYSLFQVSTYKLIYGLLLASMITEIVGLITFVVELLQMRNQNTAADVINVFSSYVQNARGVHLRKKRLSEKELALEIANTKNSILTLQQQINPHFLYNTLETIRGQALEDDAENVATMIEILSRLFRYNVGRKRELATLNEEIANLRDYITIQNYRFYGKFKFIEDFGTLSNSFDEYFLPILTLQPIVENAIYHGLEGKKSGGTVTLKVFETDDKLVIQIKDNGIGINQETLIYIRSNLTGKSIKTPDTKSKGKSLGIALINVHQRIRLFFGERYGLSIISMENIGTTVEITLPRILSTVSQFGLTNHEKRNIKP